MSDLNPEKLARRHIDPQLASCELGVQDHTAMVVSDSGGIASRIPETLLEWDAELHPLRRRLAKKRWARTRVTQTVNVCQVEAIADLEQALASVLFRCLIQLPTDPGKAFTACEFDQYDLLDDGPKFAAVYNAKHLPANIHSSRSLNT